MLPQVETYKQRYGHYPQSVLGDTITGTGTGTRGNRHYLKKKGIRFAGKPLERPIKITKENRYNQSNSRSKGVKTIGNAFQLKASLDKVKTATI